MVVDLQWSLLTNAGANLGNALVGAAGQIRDRREKSRDRDAISGYIRNPEDPASFNALLDRNPQAALTLRTQQEGRTARRNVVGAAQRGDISGARTAAVASGDADLVSLVNSLAAEDRATLRDAGPLLEGVTDEPTYQAFLRTVRRAGHDPAHLPPSFDPAAVAELRRASRIAHGGDDYTLGRGDIRYDATGRVVARGAPPPEQVVPVTQGGGVNVFRPAWGDNPESQEFVPQPGQAPPPTASAAPSGSFRVVGVPGDHETSSRRSARHNREVGGVPNSYHLSGRASDRVPPRGMSMTAFHAELQRLNPDLDVINEGDHVHLEPRGHNQPVQQAQIGGQTYYRVNGQWYDNPEGR